MEQSNCWNRARYRLYAPIYDLVARPLRRGRKRAIERLALQAGDRVLLLGAGTGVDLAHLPDDVSVTALDQMPAMVDRIEAPSAWMSTRAGATPSRSTCRPTPSTRGPSTS
jgi:SAM-dependent methyltransferase